MKWKFTIGRPPKARGTGHSRSEVKPENDVFDGRHSRNGNGHVARHQQVEFRKRLIGWFAVVATRLKAFFIPAGGRISAVLQTISSRVSHLFERIAPRLHAKGKPIVDYLRFLWRQSEIWFDSSFRNKVLLPVITCTACVLAITFSVARHQMAAQSDKEARQTLATADAALRYSQDFRRNDLLLRFHNLP